MLVPESHLISPWGEFLVRSNCCLGRKIAHSCVPDSSAAQGWKLWTGWWSRAHSGPVPLSLMDLPSICTPTDQVQRVSHWSSLLQSPVWRIMSIWRKCRSFRDLWWPRYPGWINSAVIECSLYCLCHCDSKTISWNVKKIHFQATGLTAFLKLTVFS